MEGHETSSEDVAGADGRAEIRVMMEIDGRRLVYTGADLDSVSFCPADR